MKVYIVGTGMNGRNTLTKEAEKAIDEAELLIGAERMLLPFQSMGKELFTSYIPQDIADKLGSCSYGTAAVLMSGDCGFFSGARKLLSLLGAHDVRVISGISSVSYFCSRLGITYEDMKFVSLHGKKSNIAVNVRLNERCFFLLGGDVTAADVCRALCSFGLSDVTVHIGAELGYDTEAITSGKAREFVDSAPVGLAVMITENTSALKHIPSAMSDDSFHRGNVPMTKAEVRCIAVSRLGIHTDSVVWDVGCGTGSLSVEAAFRCPDGTVSAFDKNPEAVGLTAENARLHGCDNIIVREGSCPEVLEDAAAPDAVFIGGSSGELNRIFDAIYAKNPAADIVVTAVSLETLNDAVSSFERFGAAAEISQISVARTKKLGTHTMLQAQNPVFIISGRLS